MGGCPPRAAPDFAQAILDVYARHPYERGEIAYRSEPLLDFAGLPPSELLDELARWAHEQRLQGRTVLIHCEAGKNRSGLVTGLYLIRPGYLLDALERLDGKPTEPEAVARFVRSVDTALESRQPSAGLGEDVRLRGEHVVGSGLGLEGELIQLSAFTSREGGRRAFGRIARPSRRR